MKKDSVENTFVIEGELILACLGDEQRCRLKACDVFDEIDSTNAYLLSLPVDDLCFPRVCLSARQTRGRGRRGRSWQSDSARNIYMSVAFLVDLSVQTLSALSLAVGVGVARVLQRLGVQAALKWPNDVLVEGKKMAGILLESRVKASGSRLLVIGLGLNMDMADQGEKIDQPWTDLASQGVRIDRSRLAGELLSEILVVVDEYMEGGFNRFMEEYRMLDLCYQQPLRVYGEKGVVQGRGLGVDAAGRLMVDAGGECLFFSGGDISVRLGHVAD